MKLEKKKPTVLGGNAEGPQHILKVKKGPKKPKKRARK